MPWYYPEDLKYFRKLTIGHKILMGRKTFDSIIARNNKLLPGRKHLVVTRNLDFKYPETEVISDLASFLEKEHDEEIFVIGGAEVYKYALPYTERLYITHIDKEFEGDVFFPEVDFEKFRLVEKKVINELAFCVYERVK